MGVLIGWFCFLLPLENPEFIEIAGKKSHGRSRNRTRAFRDPKAVLHLSTTRSSLTISLPLGAGEGPADGDNLDRLCDLEVPIEPTDRLLAFEILSVERPRDRVMI